MSYKILRTNMSFGTAFNMLQNHFASDLGMRLPQWKDDVVIRVQWPDENSKMTHPYLYVQSRFGNVPWKETVVEMFNNCWQLVKITEGE